MGRCFHNAQKWQRQPTEADGKFSTWAVGTASCKKLALQMLSYVDICSDVSSKMVLGRLFQTLFPGALKFKESALGAAMLIENKGMK